MQILNEDSLYNVALNAPIGICILDAATLTVEMVNDKFVEIAGKPYEAIYGKWYWEPFAEAMPYYQEALNSVVQTGKVYHAQEVKLMLIRHGKEEWVFVTFVYSPVINKEREVCKVAVWVLENTQQVRERQAINDLNEQLAAPNEEIHASNEEVRCSSEELLATQQQLESTVANLETSNYRFRNMIQASPIAILVTRGDDMVFEEINEAMLRMIGKDESVKGKPWFEAIPELVGQPVIEELYHTYRTGEEHKVTEVPIILLIDGQQYHGYYNITYTALQEDGKVTGVMQSVVDVTPYITARKEVERLNEALVASNEGMRKGNDTQIEINDELAAVNEELAASNEELTETQATLEETNQKLTESETRFRHLVQEAPVAIFVLTGRDMVFETVNNLMYRMLGKNHDIIGKPYSEAVPELIGQGFFELLDEVYTSGQSYYGNEIKGTLEVDGKPTDGYFNFIYQPVKNKYGEITGIMCVAVDVIEQVRSRKIVERAEESLRIATESGELGSWYYERSSDRFETSPRFNELFGLPISLQPSYEGVYSNIRNDYKERVTNAVNESFTSGKGFNVEYPIVLTNGGERWVRSVGKLVKDENNEYITGVLADITEQKQDDIRKNDFIGMVSHELKTPITSLNAYLQMLQAKARKAEDAFTLSALDKSVSQVRKMTKMINGFLNVSRLESGKMHIDPSRFDMAELVKEVEEESVATVTSHQIIFAPIVETYVIADRDKIGQVVNNFISNAVKYSPLGSTINVACETVGDNTQVSVKDEGFGIKAEDQQKLFDRYYRVESNAAHIAGFGIGLYLCAEIIQRHEGGKIWVESEIGKGSTFKFSIPLEK